MNVDSPDGETCSQYCSDINTDVYRVVPDLEEEVFGSSNSFGSQVRFQYSVGGTRRIGLELELLREVNYEKARFVGTSQHI